MVSASKMATLRARALSDQSNEPWSGQTIEAETLL